MPAEAPRPLEWVGSTKADIKSFPEAVREVLGYALFQAQVGLKHQSVKPLRGLGGKVLEVISRHDGDTFRAVYTVRFGTVVYVLHIFQKKAKRGIATPESEIDLIKRRLRAAEQHYRRNHGGG
ncbi:MAG: hypothetical protein F4X77_02315 [Acidobacteriia bacterium]|nr:hypothetical protein [Terriglobia bacterium]MYC67360.1 hypothetical protein [Terriglobia bacterium]